MTARWTGLTLVPATPKLCASGQSFASRVGYKRQVSDLITPRLKNTLFLASMTAIIAVPLAIALGILAALYFGNVSWGTGLIFGLKILFITAVGGYRSPLASALGAAAFGMAEALWSGYFPLLWRDAWMFVFLVLLLILKPEREPGLRMASGRA